MKMKLQDILFHVRRILIVSRIKIRRWAHAAKTIAVRQYHIMRWTLMALWGRLAYVCKPRLAKAKKLLEPAFYVSFYRKVDKGQVLHIFGSCFVLCACILFMREGYFMTIKDSLPELRLTRTAAAKTDAAPPDTLNALQPSSGQDNATEQQYDYQASEQSLDAEGVLVPQKTTVISSSHDGKINRIYFDDGDLFKKGEVLVTYTCEDLRAELETVESEYKLFAEKGSRGEKLFKLDIISEIEKMDMESELTKARARRGVLMARMQNCVIRAAYDGRVVNRLANDNEYTRTDRVLMEVASTESLDVEFLIPSKWLRWVNVDAPVTVSVSEAGETYDATITRIHGEVDPVSQSIQITAKLAPYQKPLLPGMSGTVTLDISEIRNAGVMGYLETVR